MINFKQFIGAKKNVILAVIAIILVVITAYQLKLVGIAADDDAEVVEVAQAAEETAQAVEQVTEISAEESAIEEQVESQDIASITETTLEDITVSQTKEVFQEEVSTKRTEPEEQIEKVADTEIVTNNVKEDIADVTDEKYVEDSTQQVIDEEVDIPKELIFENNEYKVTVSAIKEDALKGIKSVEAKQITVDDSNYANISNKLQEKIDVENTNKAEEEKVKLAGFLAYDIKLIDENGLEVEPDGNVNVSLEYKVIPEKVVQLSDAEVSVTHFEEDKISADVSLNELSEENQKLSVEKNEENQVKKLNFQTESFSTFTITWTYNYWFDSYSNSITVHYVDTNGKEIQGPQTKNVSDSNIWNSSVEYVFSAYANEIKNYKYVGAYLENYNQNNVTKVEFNYTNRNVTTTYYNGNSKVTSNSNQVYLVYEKDNTMVSNNVESVLIEGNSKRLNHNEVTGITLSNFNGFSWKSNNTSIATVITLPETGEPTVTAVKAGTTTIVGTRVNGEITETVNWNITVNKSLQNQIIFLHQTQNNSNFANQNSHRPHDGYGDEEVTNYVKFIVVLADKNGKMTVVNNNPDVTLPQGSVVPDKYVFDLESDKTLNITENTFAGISVPGYSYAGAYAYFGWTSNSDTKDMAIVDTFRNFGKVSTNYPSYYSALGFTTSRGKGSDYSYSTFGNNGTNYYAYNPTGVLMLVLKPVDEDISYKTYYHNDFNPGGIAQNNVVDITDAEMIKGEWISEQYKYQYKGQTIMTAKEEKDLTGPVGYKFVGWYDSVDTEGNGTGNKIAISEDNKTSDGKYYALLNNNIIEMTQNNNIYARWEPIISGLVINKTFSGGLSDTEINNAVNQITFSISNDSNENVRTINLKDFIYNSTSKVYSYEIKDLEINPTYTIKENNNSINNINPDVTYSISGANGKNDYTENGITLKLIENNQTVVDIENKYPTTLVIHKVDPTNNLITKGVSFKLETEDGKIIKTVADSTDGNVDGEITISEVKYDTVYNITEVETPEGYYTLEIPVKIKITRENEVNKIDILNSTQVNGYAFIENGILNIVNVSHVTMPKAGGMGTYWFYIMGTLTMLSTVVIYKKRSIL